MDEDRTIKLTDSDELRAKLARKLDEYNRRYAYTAPELQPHGHCKQFVLAILLGCGEVRLSGVLDQMSRFCWYSQDPTIATDAFLVIESYNNADYSKLRGGTGLK
ncbi:MAG: hypothetical protein V1738_04070 [Patescibacteria group bacterium]